MKNDEKSPAEKYAFPDKKMLAEEKERTPDMVKKQPLPDMKPKEKKEHKK